MAQNSDHWQITHFDFAPLGHLCGVKCHACVHHHTRFHAGRSVSIILMTAFAGEQHAYARRAASSSDWIDLQEQWSRCLSSPPLASQWPMLPARKSNTGVLQHDTVVSTSIAGYQEVVIFSVLVCIMLHLEQSPNTQQVPFMSWWCILTGTQMQVPDRHLDQEISQNITMLLEMES